MTLADVLETLRRQREIRVTAESLELISHVPRDAQVSLWRSIPLPADDKLRQYGHTMQLVELPPDAEPQIGDVLKARDAARL